VGITAPAGATPGCLEKLELFVLVLPVSEQLRLQHSRAIETSGALLAECAFLQQSSMFAIGQLPSCRSACTPTAAVAVMASIRTNVVVHFIIKYRQYSKASNTVSRLGQIA
jgi:hypothetical protein